MNKEIKGFKGFDSELKCRNKQYEVGKTYEENVTPKACEAGMHLCESPYDVFRYYEPDRSRYSMVKGKGEISKCDDKIACTQLEVQEEIGLSGIIQAGVKFNLDKVKWSDKASVTGDYSGASATGDYSGAMATGDYSGASATGDYSGASATGNYSSAMAVGNCSGASATGYTSSASAVGCKSGASATGDRSSASVTGNRSGALATGNYSSAMAVGNCSGASATGYTSSASAVGFDSRASAGKGSIAVAVGIRSRAKGEIGSYIVLAECKIKGGESFIEYVQVANVDGDIIKADTWYSLVNGEFIEVSE